VVNNALLNLGTIPEDKHLNITVKLPENLPLVWGNSDKLERVFINLLSNAVKYTPAKGKISITGAIQDKNLQISVSDTGIGISSKDLNRIFDEFYRVENDINSKLLGTGLGLTLVKHVIEAHKGKILARSTPGKNTTFTFNLPIDPRLMKQKKAE
jgi:two-component system phosphate regulon sensor histidine kinase PhoR